MKKNQSSENAWVYLGKCVLRTLSFRRMPVVIRLSIISAGIFNLAAETLHNKGKSDLAKEFEISRDMVSQDVMEWIQQRRVGFKW